MASKEERQKAYMEFLTREGYRPDIDSDGDVRFKHEGFTYFIEVDEKDDKYFRIGFPNFWSIDSDAERARVLVACDEATRRCKGAKVYSVRDNVWASFETFFDETRQYEPVFRRMMGALRTAVSAFVQKMKETE